MEFRIISSDVAADHSNFLTGETLKKIENKTAWMLAAISDENEIGGVAIFEKIGNLKDALRMSYLYVTKDYRDEGLSIGLLEYARKQFYPKGIRRFLCSLSGTIYDIYDLSTYLPVAGFLQSEQIWHVYSYDRSRMLETKTAKKILAGENTGVSHMTEEEVKYLLRMDRGISPALRDIIFYECDIEKSYFEFEQDTLKAAVLVKKDEAGGMDVMRIYMHPNWKNKEKILYFLMDAIQETEDTKIHLAVTGDQVLALYQYMFGLPESDFWILSYEKELKGDM